MTEHKSDPVKLVEEIAKRLVDDPAQVFVEAFEEEGETVVELEVAENEVSKIIGRQGRTARALRNVLSAAGQKQHKRYSLEIID